MTPLEDYWKAVRPNYRGGRSQALTLVGQVFTRLTVIEREGSDKHGNAMWRCRCECGKEKVVSRPALRQGRVKSCGCLQRQYRKQKKMGFGREPDEGRPAEAFPDDYVNASPPIDDE